MATTFKDARNRTWDMALNINAFRRVRDRLEINLLDGQQAIDRLLNDPAMLVDTIFVIAMPQCETAGVTDEDFGEAMGGDAIDAATVAFLEAFVNFSPPAKRRALTKLLAKIRQLEAMRAQKAEQQVDAGVLDTLVEKELQQTDQRIQKILKSS